MTKLRFIRNLFSEPVQGTVLNSTEPFFQLYGEVRVEKVPGTGVYTKTTDYLLDPLEGITADFVLNSGFRGFFVAPYFNPFAITAMQKVTYNVLKGKFFGAEYFGTPPVAGIPAEVEDFVVLNGGISNAVGVDAGLSKLMPTYQKFLSFAPTTKLIGPSQPELLHYLVYQEGISNLTLNIRITYTDGSENILSPLSLSVVQWDLVRIPVGMEVLDLFSIDFAKSISEYQVWLESDATRVSEIRSYELDYDEQPYARMWIYENSLGMPEVFRTTGKTSYKTEVKTTTSKRALVYDTTQTDARFFSNQVMSRIRQEISTGYLRDLNTARYMVDFLVQKGSLFEITPAALIPMQLTTSGLYEETIDGEYNYYLRFTAQGAFEDESYTG